MGRHPSLSSTDRPDHAKAIKPWVKGARASLAPRKNEWAFVFQGRASQRQGTALSKRGEGSVFAGKLPWQAHKHRPLTWLRPYRECIVSCSRKDWVGFRCGLIQGFMISSGPGSIFL